MTQQELTNIIILQTKKVLTDSGYPDQLVSPDSKFSDLQLDSLQFIELLSQLEEATRVELLDSEFYGVQTISDASELIKQKLGENRGIQD